MLGLADDYGREPMSTPDEPGTRSGSSASLLLTIVGLFVRRLGGWIATADLVSLASDAGVDGAAARTAIARLKKRGILNSVRHRGTAGYELSSTGVRILERGDRHILTAYAMQRGDRWCVVSFSVPEARRSLRAQLRKRLGQIGCGQLAPALWICPDHLRDEVAAILDELELWRFSVILITEDPVTASTLREGIAQWWDLDAIADVHSDFLARAAAPPLSADDDVLRFRRYVEIVDAWRPVPYADPGLPADQLPDDWPGRASLAAFREAAETLAESAWAHVRDRVHVVHERSGRLTAG